MADETFELFSITNKLTLDTAQFDRAYNDSRGKMRTLAGEVNKLETATKSGAGGFNTYGGALNALSPKLGMLAAGGPMGLAVAGVGALTSGVAAAAAGVWALTKNFSDAASELDDLSQQVNFSTTTLGTFSAAGKMVGVDIDSLSASFTKFQKNLAEGNEIFKILGVTSTDNEIALRQTMKAVSEITDKTLQSAVAQEVFGKSGKAMLAIIKSTGGDLDVSAQQLRKWNVLLSDEAIAIGDEFGDKLSEMQLRLQGVGNTIGTETAPAFTAGFIAISAALDANMVAWDEWGEFVAKVILSATVALGGYLNMAKNLSWQNFIPGYGAYKAGSDFFEGMEKTADLVVPEYAKRKATLNPSVGVDVGGDAFRKKSPYEQMLADYFKNKGGGGKGGKSDAQREAEREARELERLMEQRGDMIERMNLEYKRLSDQLQGVDVNTRSYAVAESQLTGILKGASPQLIKQAEAIAKSVDNRQKQLALQNELAAYLKQQDAAVRLAIEGEKSHVDATEDFIASLEKQGAVLQETTKKQMRFNAVTRDSFENIARLAENIDKVLDKFPLPEIVFPTQSEDEISRCAGEAANRDAGLPPEMRESALLKWRNLIEDFSFDITDVIDRAITRGFEDGMSAGIKEFGLGILEMAKHEALDALQKAIAEALGGGEGGQGKKGDGIFSTLIKFGINALLGGVSGGGGGGGLGSASAGAIGGHAGGGFMYPNEWSWVGERGPELIKAGSRGASVMSNQESGMFGGGGLTVYQTINVPDMYAAGNRQTQTQAFRGLTQAAQRGYSLKG